MEKKLYCFQVGWCPGKQLTIINVTQCNEVSRRACLRLEGFSLNWTKTITRFLEVLVN
jgi:hypothetical protein